MVLRREVGLVPQRRLRWLPKPQRIFIYIGNLPTKVYISKVSSFILPRWANMRRFPRSNAPSLYMAPI